MKKNIPHSLKMDCSYEVLNSSVKAKLGTSELQGFIEIGSSRGKIVLPMRSFVRAFIDRLQQIFAGENTSDITKISTASFGASLGASVVDKAGILLGEDDTPVAITNTDLGNAHRNDVQCQYKSTTFVAPFASTANILKTQVKRLFSNASSSQWTIQEIGLKTKKTASTASNAGLILISRDVIGSSGSELDGPPTGAVFPAGEDLRVVFDLSVQRPETGGAVLNMLRLIYNLYLKGSANASTFIPRSGTVTVSHPNASATSFFVMDGGVNKYWGIVVGYYDELIHATISTVENPNRSTPSIASDEHNFTIRTSGLTYGANTVSPVQIAANRAYFTITRDITNSGTTNQLIDRIGLLSKGATADPSSLQADQVFLMINKPVSPPVPNIATAIMLQPGQTLRVTYTFECEA